MNDVSLPTTNGGKKLDTSVRMLQWTVVFLLGALGAAIGVPTIAPETVRPDPWRGRDALLQEQKAMTRQEQMKLEMLERITTEAEQTRALLEHRLEIHELRGHSANNRYQIDELP